MFDFPRVLHRLSLFEEDGVLYAADIEKARVVEISAVMVDILKLAEEQRSEEIVQTLNTSYPEDEIYEAFERLAEFEREGLLFNRGENLRGTFAIENKRRKLLVVIPNITTDSFFDIETLYAGTNMALSYMFEHLTKYVDLHFAGNQNRKLADSVYEVDIRVSDFGRLSRRLNETYFGILTLHRDHETWLLPLYEHIELPPILVQCHAPRGHGGKAINSILRHYAAMRDFDAFTAPSDYVREFYSDYVWDSSFFNTLPNGVDSALFRPRKKGVTKRKVGRPKIKPNHKYNSLTFTQAGFKIEGNRIYIRCLKKSFTFWKHRDWTGRIKTVTIKRDNVGDYYLYITCEGCEPSEKLPLTGNVAGADFGMKTFLTLSDGTKIASPEFYKQGLTAVHSANKALSRKQKGSHAWYRAKRHLSRVHKKIANQRREWFFKLALRLVRKYDTIAIEALNLEGMKKLWGRKISDIAFGEFALILHWTCAKYGKTFAQAGRWTATTKPCSVCGHHNENLTLQDRQWICPECGSHHDRDINAARNILQAGVPA